MILQEINENQQNQNKVKKKTNWNKKENYYLDIGGV